MGRSRISDRRELIQQLKYPLAIINGSGADLLVCILFRNRKFCIKQPANAGCF